MIIRFWKLVLAWLISELRKRSATRTQARTQTPATKSSATTSVVDIGKRDLVDALDGQIAVLNERRKYYQKQADECYKPEDKLKLMDKVARIEVQIAQKEVRVLKLREEIDK